MEVFQVPFILKSFYEHEENNLVVSHCEEFEAESLEDLLEKLGDEDVIDSIDETPVINSSVSEPPDEVNIEYVLVRDSAGNIVYRDEDYDG